MTVPREGHLPAGWLPTITSNWPYMRSYALTALAESRAVGASRGRRLRSTLGSSPAGVSDLVFGCEKADRAQRQRVLVLVLQLVLKSCESVEPIRVRQL